MEQMLMRMLQSLGFDSTALKAQIVEAVTALRDMEATTKRIEAAQLETKLADFAQYVATADMSGTDRAIVLSHINEFQRFGFSKVAIANYAKSVGAPGNSGLVGNPLGKDGAK